MSFSLPTQIFDKWREIAAYLLTDSNFSREATLIFPPKHVAVTSSAGNNLAGQTQNVFAHGGPAPFSFGEQDDTGGRQYKEEETTRTIRLRVYFEKKNFIKTTNIVIPANAVQIIGAMTDLPLLKAASAIRLLSDITGLNINCVLAGDPFPYGFGRTQNFIAYLVEA